MYFTKYILKSYSVVVSIRECFFLQLFFVAFEQFLSNVVFLLSDTAILFQIYDKEK